MGQALPELSLDEFIAWENDQRERHVDPDTREVQLFRRGADGLFTLHDLSGAAQLPFTSIDCTVSAEDLFDGIEPVAAPA